MSPIPVNLAIEDELSESVIRALIKFVNRDYFIGTVYGRTGFGYLRKTVKGWNSAAKGIPFILLTDLDQSNCAPALIQEWLAGPPAPNLIFRVAVREVEAWLLADPSNFASFLTVPEEAVPTDCDDLADPKEQVIQLARRARSRDIRERMVPRAGSTAKQGPDYNACLDSFVRNHWDIAVARGSSPSLNRAVLRLQSFEPTWPEGG